MRLWLIPVALVLVAAGPNVRVDCGDDIGVFFVEDPLEAPCTASCPDGSWIIKGEKCRAVRAVSAEPPSDTSAAPEPEEPEAERGPTIVVIPDERSEARKTQQRRLRAPKMRMDRVWRSPGGSYAMGLVTVTNYQSDTWPGGELDCIAIAPGGQKLNIETTRVPAVGGHRSREVKVTIHVGERAFESMKCTLRSRH